MTKIVDKKLQSINRNLSVDRERISNACLIGLYVALGHSVTVKLPSKRAKNTLPHLSISSTEYDGMDINDYVQSQYHFTMVMDKNKRRDHEVAIFNAIATKVTGTHFKLAKRTVSVKTLKLKIFREIAFLSKNGMKVFGTKVIMSVMNRNLSGKCSQKAVVELEGCDEEIMMILREICEEKENVNEYFINEYSMMYKGIFRNEQSEISQSYQSYQYSQIGQTRSEENIFYGNGDRGVFRSVDPRTYQIVSSDWFF